MMQIIQHPLFAILVALWTLPWKGYALWISARKGEKWWFIALLVLNTLAILEILYIFIFSKKHTETKKNEDEEIKNIKPVF